MAPPLDSPQAISPFLLCYLLLIISCDFPGMIRRTASPLYDNIALVTLLGLVAVTLLFSPAQIVAVMTADGHVPPWVMVIFETVQSMVLRFQDCNSVRRSIKTFLAVNKFASVDQYTALRFLPIVHFTYTVYGLCRDDFNTPAPIWTRIRQVTSALAYVKVGAWLFGTSPYDLVGVVYAILIALFCPSVETVDAVLLRVFEETIEVLRHRFTRVLGYCILFVLIVYVEANANWIFTYDVYGQAATQVVTLWRLGIYITQRGLRAFVATLSALILKIHLQNPSWPSVHLIFGIPWSLFVGWVLSQILFIPSFTGIADFAIGIVTYALIIAQHYGFRVISRVESPLLEAAFVIVFDARRLAPAAWVCDNAISPLHKQVLVPLYGRLEGWACKKPLQRCFVAVASAAADPISAFKVCAELYILWRRRLRTPRLPPPEPPRPPETDAIAEFFGYNESPQPFVGVSDLAVQELFWGVDRKVMRQLRSTFCENMLDVSNDFKPLSNRQVRYKKRSRQTHVDERLRRTETFFDLCLREPVLNSEPLLHTVVHRPRVVKSFGGITMVRRGTAERTSATTRAPEPRATQVQPSSAVSAILAAPQPTADGDSLDTPQQPLADTRAFENTFAESLATASPSNKDSTHIVTQNIPSTAASSDTAATQPTAQGDQVQQPIPHATSTTPSRSADAPASRVPSDEPSVNTSDDTIALKPTAGESCASTASQSVEPATPSDDASFEPAGTTSPPTDVPEPRATLDGPLGSTPVSAEAAEAEAVDPPPEDPAADPATLANAFAEPLEPASPCIEDTTPRATLDGPLGSTATQVEVQSDEPASPCVEEPSAHLSNSNTALAEPLAPASSTTNASQPRDVQEIPLVSAPASQEAQSAQTRRRRPRRNADPNSFPTLNRVPKPMPSRALAPQQTQPSARAPLIDSPPVFESARHSSPDPPSNIALEPVDQPDEPRVEPRIHNLSPPGRKRRQRRRQPPPEPRIALLKSLAAAQACQPREPAAVSAVSSRPLAEEAATTVSVAVTSSEIKTSDEALQGRTQRPTEPASQPAVEPTVSEKDVQMDDSLLSASGPVDFHNPLLADLGSGFDPTSVDSGPLSSNNQAGLLNAGASNWTNPYDGQSVGPKTWVDTPFTSSTHMVDTAFRFSAPQLFANDNSISGAPQAATFFNRELAESKHYKDLSSQGQSSPDPDTLLPDLGPMESADPVLDLDEMDLVPAISGTNIPASLRDSEGDETMAEQAHQFTNPAVTDTEMYEDVGPHGFLAAQFPEVIGGTAVDIDMSDSLTEPSPNLTVGMAVDTPMGEGSLELIGTQFIQPQESITAAGADAEMGDADVQPSTNVTGGTSTFGNGQSCSFVFGLGNTNARDSQMADSVNGSAFLTSSNGASAPMKRSSAPQATDGNHDNGRRGARKANARQMATRKIQKPVSRVAKSYESGKEKQKAVVDNTNIDHLIDPQLLSQDSNAAARTLFQCYSPPVGYTPPTNSSLSAQGYSPSPGYTPPANPSPFTQGYSPPAPSFSSALMNLTGYSPGGNKYGGSSVAGPSRTKATASAPGKSLPHPSPAAGNGFSVTSPATYYTSPQTASVPHTPSRYPISPNRNMYSPTSPAGYYPSLPRQPQLNAIPSPSSLPGLGYLAPGPTNAASNSIGGSGAIVTNAYTDPHIRHAPTTEAKIMSKAQSLTETMDAREKQLREEARQMLEQVEDDAEAAASKAKRAVAAMDARERELREAARLMEEQLEDGDQMVSHRIRRVRRD